jgi:hypothetical protein
MATQSTRRPGYGEQERLQRIASAGQAQLTPSTGITSSVERLANAIRAIDDHVGRVAAQHAVKKLDILDELYRRNEPHR